MTETVLAVIGLGYVGLPLAVEFGRRRPTVGFDIDETRVSALRQGRDHTQEVRQHALDRATHLQLTSDMEDLRAANVFIVTVPTPIDASKRPDLRPLESASRTVGSVLEHGDLVIYESTVYPGATEEVCVPILEATSGLRFNEGFTVGYSPERINPGDREHRLDTIVKVTSGSTPEAADRVDTLYAEVVTAGTHRASSIRVAEAAKVIENTQRDVNIALINELAVLFSELGLDTLEVLEAAGTKWNFLPFRPGLVGGHCIGVDPYYLTHKAQEVGHHPDVILAGRRINDAMGSFIAERLTSLMGRAGVLDRNARVLVLGLAFKENCPDLRNTRVVDILQHLERTGIGADVVDPWVDADEALSEHGVRLLALDSLEQHAYAAVVLAVAHDQFADLHGTVRDYLAPNGVVFDVKGMWPRSAVDARL